MTARTTSGDVETSVAEHLVDAVIEERTQSGGDWRVSMSGTVGRGRRAVPRPR